MKELEDFDWFPEILRNQQTEFIGYVVTRFHIYQTLQRYLQSRIPKGSSIVDLCSGSGQPAISLFCGDEHYDTLVLTDKFPNKNDAVDDGCFYDPSSQDVLEMNFDKKNIYTMFNSFHHFKDDEQLKLIRRMRASGSEAYFVEILSPDLLCFLKVLAMTTVGQIFLAPFVKPFSWSRLFFTYIIPVNILTIAWDGIVSVLKSKSVKAYRELLQNENFRVNVINIRGRLQSILVIHVERHHEANSSTLEI